MKWMERKTNMSNHVNSKQQHILRNKQTFCFPFFHPYTFCLFLAVFYFCFSHIPFLHKLCKQRNRENDKKNMKMTDNGQICTTRTNRNRNDLNSKSEIMMIIINSSERHTFNAQSKETMKIPFAKQKMSTEPITKEHILIMLCAFQLWLLLESDTNWQWCAWNVWTLNNNNNNDRKNKQTKNELVLFWFFFVGAETDFIKCNNNRKK